MPMAASATQRQALPLHRHQVAGKLPMLWNHGKIYKPAFSSEVQFYEEVPSEFPSLVPFVPDYHGVIKINPETENLDSQELQKSLAAAEHHRDAFRSQYRKDGTAVEQPLSDDDSDSDICSDILAPTREGKGSVRTADGGFSHHTWSSICFLRKNRNRPRENSYLALTDMTRGFKRPCILDLKIGTRFHGHRASPEKIRSQKAKSRWTTSHSLGLRLSGMQVYQTANGRYRCFDKYFGRRLAKKEFKRRLAEFFHNGQQFRADILPCFINRLQQLLDIVEGQTKYRFYSSSVLLVYEGDANRTATLRAGKRPRRCSSTDNLLFVNQNAAAAASSSSSSFPSSADQSGVSTEVPSAVVRPASSPMSAPSTKRRPAAVSVPHMKPSTSRPQESSSLSSHLPASAPSSSFSPASRTSTSSSSSFAKADAHSSSEALITANSDTTSPSNTQPISMPTKSSRHRGASANDHLDVDHSGDGTSSTRISSSAPASMSSIAEEVVSSAQSHSSPAGASSVHNDTIDNRDFYPTSISSSNSTACSTPIEHLHQSRTPDLAPSSSSSLRHRHSTVLNLSTSTSDASTTSSESYEGSTSLPASPTATTGTSSIHDGPSPKTYKSSMFTPSGSSLKFSSSGSADSDYNARENLTTHTCGPGCVFVDMRLIDFANIVKTDEDETEPDEGLVMGLRNLLRYFRRLVAAYCEFEDDRRKADDVRSQHSSMTGGGGGGRDNESDIVERAESSSSEDDHK